MALKSLGFLLDSFPEKKSGAVLQAFKMALHVTDCETAQSQLRELKPKAYPSLAALRKMQAIMAAHDSRNSAVRLANLVDESFVRTLGKSGAIGRLYDAYGVEC